LIKAEIEKAIVNEICETFDFDNEPEDE